MFGFFQAKLTEATGHYIDWTRPGQLLFNNYHSYTRRELLERAFVMSGLIGGALLGKNISQSLLFATLGFLGTHAITMSPYLYKRHQLSQANNLLEKSMRENLRSLNMSSTKKELIESVIAEIQKLSLTTAKSGRASETLGKRNRLLNVVNQNLSNEQFWDGDKNDMLQKLDGAAPTASQQPRLTR